MMMKAILEIDVMTFPLPFKIARVGGESKLPNILPLSRIHWPAAHCNVYDFINQLGKCLGRKEHIYACQEPGIL